MPKFYILTFSLQATHLGEMHRYDLAPDKDLAVSLSLFYPHSEIRPSTLGSGPPGTFGRDVTVRTSSALAGEMAAFNRYFLLGVRTFLSDFTSEQLSDRQLKLY